VSGPAASKGRSTDERLAREIEHGRKIAWNAESVWFWESPAGRRRAERRAELFIEHGGLAPGKRALELGCGTGVFLERVAHSGAQIHGLDVSEDLLEKARARTAGLSNVVVERGNAEASPYPAGHFDAVYGSSILHHLELDAALAEAHRVLRPGGRVVFAEPNILNFQVLLMFRFRPLKERFGVTPDEMAFSRFRARRALERAGFVDVAVEPFDFLHPSIPVAWVERGLAASRALERLPLVREIAGSMLMRARRA
jgi:SAM-dependent methyltransferase